jgi:hypothetical protein
MSAKKSFVLRLDPEMYNKIEKWAADEFRSVNGQVEWLIREALKKSGRLKITVSESQDNDSKSVDESTQS